VRLDAGGAGLLAVRDARGEASLLDARRRLCVIVNRDEALAGEHVAPERITPLPQGDGRPRARTGRVRRGDKGHAGDPDRSGAGRREQPGRLVAGSLPTVAVCGVVFSPVYRSAVLNA